MRKQGIKNIALITETSALGQSGKKESENLAAEYGLNIVVNETYGPKDTDVTPQLTKVKNNADVDATFVFGMGQGPAIVSRNYRSLDIKPPLYQSHGVCSDEFIRLAGNAAEDIILPCSALAVADILPEGDPQKPVVTSYKEAYENRWKTDVSSFGGLAYDSLMIYLDAVKETGTTDRQKVRDAIENTSGFVGTGGIVNMTPEDHLGLALDSFKMLKIKDGDWTLLE